MRYMRRMSHTLNPLASGLLYAMFGTVFLAIYIKFQKKLNNISKFGVETEGEIIYMSSVQMGRGEANRPVVEFKADGVITHAANFTVKYSTPVEVGQKVIVIYNQYNPDEYLIKTYDAPDKYLNDEHGFGGKLGLIAGAVLWLMAIVNFAQLFS